MAVTVQPVVYPAGQTFIRPGQAATVTATSDKDRDVTVTLNDGGGTGTAVVAIRAGITASVPAGSPVTLANPSPGVFTVTAL